MTDEEIAKGLTRINGVLYAPCETWEKDGATITNGRIGKPVVRMCPLDWHPQERIERILMYGKKY